MWQSWKNLAMILLRGNPCRWCKYTQKYNFGTAQKLFNICQRWKISKFISIIYFDLKWLSLFFYCLWPPGQPHLGACALKSQTKGVTSLACFWHCFHLVYRQDLNPRPFKSELSSLPWINADCNFFKLPLNMDLEHLKQKLQKLQK